MMNDLHTRAFWLLVALHVIAAFVLARLIQFFAMGWRWNITEQQLANGFNQSKKHRDFWQLLAILLLMAIVALLFELRSASH